ncbi:hypothetical protein PHABIO_380 [Pseudomonas phage Phabio]|uniref:Uncharacterized protein n=1 Tax=Pseudomonas phage Phabio TaxID=2006668 RepID=A0A1Y0SU26_9CAUD|nr:hypothetical protein MZD05_gp380 [Pseudomonas phage Phabio]ARV77011.1 hypothetical protein PHABIO_380 [Pseudomonas phage Phabio]
MELLTSILFILGVIGLGLTALLLLLVAFSNLAHALGAHVPDYPMTLKAFIITGGITVVIWISYWSGILLIKHS